MRIGPAILSLALAHLPAQTFVVDAQNGPGTNFTDLAAAIAAVPGGAILLVRTGSYTPFVIDQKSLTILADGTANVSSLGQGSTIKNLLPTQQVTLRGLRFSGGITSSFVRCIDNNGPVLIDSCNGYGVYTTNGASIEATRCIDVQIRNGMFRPIGVPLLCIDSVVRAAGSTFEVGSQYPGAWVYQSNLELIDCTLLGATGAPGRGAIALTNSTLRVIGNSSLSTTHPWPVVTGIGTVRVAPSVLLLSGGSAPFTPLLQVTTLTMPGVTANVAPQGGPTTVSMTGPTNGIGALFVGFAGPLLPLAPFADPIGILAGTETLLAQGTLNTSLAATYTLPLQPHHLGLRLTAQGASIDASNGAQISNALTYVHF